MSPEPEPKPVPAPAPSPDLIAAISAKVNALESNLSDYRKEAKKENPDSAKLSDLAGKVDKLAADLAASKIVVPPLPPTIGAPKSVWDSFLGAFDEFAADLGFPAPK